MCAGAAPEHGEEGGAQLFWGWILQTSSPAVFEEHRDMVWALVLRVLSLSPSRLPCWMLPQGRRRRRRRMGCGTCPGGYQQKDLSWSWMPTGTCVGADRLQVCGGLEHPPSLQSPLPPCCPAAGLGGSPVQASLTSCYFQSRVRFASL